MKIYCGASQCGHYLGDVGPSAVGMNPNPVWRIQPGWNWKQGILERSDYQLRMERKLLHETFGKLDQNERVGLAREANLPIVVRCPQCHALRYVRPDVVLRPILSARA